MKAVVVEAPHVVALKEVDAPELRPQDVLVRVCYAGICGTDLDIVKGEIDLVTEGRIRYPLRIGHEWSGVVVRIGAEVKGFEPGDRVVSEPGLSCGCCPACLKGNYGDCETGLRAIGTIDNAWPGAMADYMSLPWWSLHKIPDNVSLDAAALTEPASIAFSAIMNVNIQPEDYILIIGTGAIGLAAVGLLKCMGFSRILMAGRQDEKLRIARNMGASSVINMLRENLDESVLALTKGHGADVVLESSGVASCVEQALRVLADKGRLLLYSFYAEPLREFNVARLSSHSISMIGVSVKLGTMGDILKWMADGSLNLLPLITHRLPFARAADILQDIGQAGNSRIKILLDMGVG